MPRHLTAFPTIAKATLVASLLSTSLTAQAPDDGGGSPALPRFEARPALLSLNFPGGTLADYVALLQRSAEPANIIVVGPAETIILPAFELRNVDLGSATQLLSRQIHAPSQVAAGIAPERIPMVGVEVIQQRPGVGAAADGTPSAIAPIITVTVLPQMPRHPNTFDPSNESPTFSVVSIAPLVFAGLEPRDVLDAVQAALRESGEADRGASIGFHEATNLIMVRATIDGTEVVREAIVALDRSANPGPTPDAAHAHDLAREAERLRNENRRLAGLIEEVAALRAEIHILRDELHAARQRLRELGDRPGTPPAPPAPGGAGAGGGTGAPGVPGAPGAPGGAPGGAGGHPR